MAFCPNCGTQYEVLPARCQCGNLFGSPTAEPLHPPIAEIPAPGAARFEFSGEGGTLLLLYFKLVVYSIFTLGIYSFWGRTEIRRYLWSNLKFSGKPFEYHGTGKELLLGWLMLIALLGVLYGSSFAAIFYLGKSAGPEISILFALLLALLVPFAIHGALRYRWSRTSWQGRRFAYRGDLMRLAIVFWSGLLLTVVTLSIYLPFFLANMRRQVVDNTWYGGQQFRFSGDGKELLWPYVKFLLLFLPTFTLYRFWFQAKLGNYSWNETSFAGSPFRSTLSGDGLLILTITNAILTFCTLGIGYPWAVCRQVSYVAENLQLTALPRVQLVEQPGGADSAFGDTLGNVLGTDAGIDAGFGL